MVDQKPTKGRILIVDDKIEVTELLEDFFTRHGYDSQVAQESMEAERFLRTGQYQLVLTDIIFFQSGGVDLIRTIRQKDPRTPIVAMTGYGPEMAQEAMKAGANGFLLKPFSLTQLEKKIGRYIHVEKPGGDRSSCHHMAETKQTTKDMADLTKEPSLHKMSKEKNMEVERCQKKGRIRGF